jgi:hypothetical protein
MIFAAVLAQRSAAVSVAMRATNSWRWWRGTLRPRK